MSGGPLLPKVRTARLAGMAALEPNVGTALARGIEGARSTGSGRRRGHRDGAGGSAGGDATGRLPCLIYLSQSYSGRGPAESCVQVIKYFREAGLDCTLFVGRARSAIPSSIKVRSALPALFNHVPWRLARRVAARRLDRKFIAALSRKGPRGIVYFWPDHDIAMVRRARAEGWMVVREMTNRTLAAAKESLDLGFAKAGEARPHHIPAARVLEENALLREFDFVFSSNDEVDASLRAAGVAAERILPTSFGWPDEKFGSVEPRPTGGPLRIGYLGTISIGKGVRDLLDGFRMVPGDAVLELAGPLDWSMEQAVKAACAADPRIRHLGYVKGVSGFFGRCDIVVIPTLDEGGPQVTYEAAAAGAAIIGTAMAKARLLDHERNALIVPLHDPAAIAAAISRLVADPAERRRLGDQVRQDVRPFAYSRVGTERAEMLRDAYERVRADPALAASARHGSHAPL